MTTINLPQKFYGEQPGAIRPLAARGFPEAYLHQLQARGLGTPLPLQEEVLEQGALLTGKSCLISAPTASGKTLIAEWCALARILENKRVFYLVPTRALAEEKAREFYRVFTPLGATVALSTGDYAEEDEKILKGDVSLVVTVVEKANALLAQSRLSWKTYGLFVVDEAHLLGDSERGPSVDLFLTQWKLHPDRPQLLALSAVVGKPESVADWLGISCLLSSHRIAPLREGVCNLETGVYTFRDSETKQRGEEKLLPERAESLGAEVFCRLVRGNPANSTTPFNRVLVFVSTRQEAYRNAREVADFLESQNKRLGNLQPQHGEVERQHEQGFQDFLASICRVGVGVHSADLTSAERQNVEQAFKKGECPLLFATPTLEQGVNLSADIVVQEPMMFGEDSTGTAAMTLLSASRFRNQGGRAGRSREGVGRSIVFARNSLEKEQLWASIVLKSPEPLESALVQNQLLSFFAQQLMLNKRLTVENLQKRLSHTFAAQNMPMEKCMRATHLGLTRGTELGLWRKETSSGEVELTALGEILALQRIQPQTLYRWSELVGSIPKNAFTVGNGAMMRGSCLWALLDSAEGKRLNMRGAFPTNGELQKHFLLSMKQCPLGSTVLQLIENQGGWTSSRKSTLKQVLALENLLSTTEETSELINQPLTVSAGQLENVFRQLEWLLRAFSQLAELLGEREWMVESINNVRQFCVETRRALAPENADVVADEIVAVVDARPAAEKNAFVEESEPEAENKPLPTAEVMGENLEPTKPINHKTPLKFTLNYFGRVEYNETLIELTPLQYRLLTILALQPGIVVKYFEINRLMWPDDPKFDQQINYHRAKLEKALGVTTGTLIRCQSGHGLWLEMCANQVFLEAQVLEELGLQELIDETG